MALSSLRWMFGLLLVLSLAACGGSDGKDGARGSNGQDAKPVLVKTTPEPAGLNCPSGGSRIDSGIDANLSGVLDPAEFQTVSYVCNGEDGADGQDGTNGQDGADGQDGSDGLLALVQTTAISSGAECPSGGVRIDAGIDINESGSLDAAEIQQTSFVCNGSDGADGADGQDGQDGQDGADGLSALIRTELQSPGAICPAGGIRVLSGVDVNRNGQLDAGEETQTSYLCNGVAGQDGDGGANALLASTQIPSGAQCVSGGYRIDTGLDSDDNGLLEGAEVTSSFYVCNGSDGADGRDGMDGPQSLIDISTEAPGANCVEGGKLIQTGVDLNANGLLEAGEVEQSGFLCNGSDGIDGLNGSDGTDGQDGANGQDGADGQNGLNSLVSYTDEPAGANCAAGGIAVNTGLDTDTDNVLDAAEIQSTTYVCHGTGGPDEQTFILQYGAQAGGSLVGTPVQEVLLGGSGESVTAVPDSGYYFTSWSDGNTSASRVDSAAQSDLNVVAGFSLYQYTLTYTAGSNGSISGIVGQTVFHGEDGTSVEAVPNNGYHFTQWSDGSVLNPRIDLANEDDISVAANFKVAEYSLNYQSGEGGSIAGNGSQFVEHGNDGMVVAAVADSGYRFVQWSDGVTTANRVDMEVTSDLRVTAEFVEILAAPGDLQSGAEGGDLVLSWRPVSNASSYNVYYAQESGVNPDNYQSLSGGGAVFSVQNPLTLSDLDGGQRYYFVITTNIGSEESSPSEELSSLLPNTPWMKKMHKGGVQVEPLSMRSVEIHWDDQVGESYSIFISTNPEADLSQYSSYGVELQLAVQPPVVVDDLKVGQPVYIALEKNGVIDDWTQYTPRTWGIGGGANSRVFDQAIDDGGERYVGGSFSSVGMNTGGAAVFPLNNSDAPHVLSVPEVNGTVFAAVSDGKGGWYFGGDFTNVGTEERLRLAHVDSSGRLSSWNPGTDNSVYALDVVGETVFAGGDFLAAGNGSATIARGRFAAFDEDGNILPWNPIFDAPILDFEEINNELYVGGYFTAVSGAWGNSSNAGLARFDIDTGQNLGTSINDIPCVSSLLAAPDGTMYIGGGNSAHLYYCQAGPGYLAALNTSSGNLVSEWNPFVSGGVNALALKGDVIYAAGVLTSARSGYSGSVPQVQNRPGRIAAFSTQIPGELLDWEPDYSGSSLVNSLFVKGDVIYGNFMAYTDQGMSAFYTHDASFPLVPGAKFPLELRVGVNALMLASDDSTIFTGGTFKVAGGERRMNLAAFDGGGYPLEWNPGVSGPVSAIELYDGVIYAGGRFSSAGDGMASTERHNLAAFNRNGDLMSWNASVCPDSDLSRCNQYSSMKVNDIEASAGVIYVGGNFGYSQGNGIAGDRMNLAAFDSSGSLTPWNPGASSSVLDIESSSGAIYVAGGFTSVGGGSANIARDRIAAISSSGEVLGWAPGVDNVARNIEVINGVVYVGGGFHAATGSNGAALREGLAAFGQDGTLMSWDASLDGGVYDLFSSEGRLFLSGEFSTIGAVSRNGIASFSTDGNLSDWEPVIDGTVYSIESSGENVYLGGWFSHAGEGAMFSRRSGLAVFDLTGSLLNQ